MKKMIKNLMLVAVAAMAFVGCEQDIEVNNITKKTTLEFIADIENETRSQFGEKVDGFYTSTWTGNETAKFNVWSTSNGNVGNAESTIKDGRFSVEFGVNSIPQGYIIDAYTPAASWSDVTNIWHDNYSWAEATRTYTIPTEQTPTANSVDEKAHILKATASYNGSSLITLNFEHQVAYGKLSFKNLALEEGDSVSSVVLDIDGKKYTINTSATEGIWFACEPTEAVSDMTVSVNSVNGKGYSKTIVTAGNKALAFAKGGVSTFTVNMEGIGSGEVADTFNPDVYLNAPVIDSNNGTCFKFTFKDNSINYYRVWLAEENRANDMMAVGNYKGNGVGSSDNYTPDASHFAATMYDNFGRVQGSYARHHTENSTLDVTYADGAYTIIITHNGTTYGYKGMPEGWEAPSGGEEPGEPVEPTIKETYNVTWEYYFDFSNSGTFGHVWNVNSNDGGFSAKITTDSRNDYTTATSFTPGTYSYHTKYADGDYAAGMWFTMAADSIIIEGKTYGASDFDGEMTVVANSGAYDITVVLYSATDSTKITTLVGTFGTSTGGDTELTALETPVVTATASETENSITVAWGEVANAVGYKVTFNGNTETVTALTQTYTGLDWGTKYNVEVVAVAATDSEEYKDSEAGTASATTIADPNASSSDESVLVSCKYNGVYEGLLNHFQLKSSSGNTVINLLFGTTYTNSTTIYAQTYNSDSAINTYKSDSNGAGNLVCVNGMAHTIDGVSVSGNQSGSTVKVSKSGSTYTINITLSLSNGETKEYTFVGALS